MPFQFIIPAILAAAKMGADLAQSKAASKRAANQTRFSPWTGISPQKVTDPNLLGSGAQGAMAGLEVWKGIQGLTSGGDTTTPTTKAEAVKPVVKAPAPKPVVWSTQTAPVVPVAQENPWAQIYGNAYPDPTYTPPQYSTPFTWMR